MYLLEHSLNNPGDIGQGAIQRQECAEGKVTDTITLLVLRIPRKPSNRVRDASNKQNSHLQYFTVHYMSYNGQTLIIVVHFKLSEDLLCSHSARHCSVICPLQPDDAGSRKSAEKEYLQPALSEADVIENPLLQRASNSDKAKRSLTAKRDTIHPL